MTPKRSSTSSTRTARSKRSKDVLSLGRRLVQELKLNETCNTLAKWMSHYLAEQMLAVQAAKGRAAQRAAEDHCCEVILRLWAARANLPGTARPLGRLDEAIKALEEMRSDQTRFPAMVRRASGQAKSPWLGFARDSYAAERRMACIAFLAGVLEASFGQEKRWVDEHSSHLSEQERDMVDSLDGWLKTDVCWLTGTDRKSVGQLPPKERTETILKELDAVITEQSRAYQALKRQLKPRRKRS